MVFLGSHYRSPMELTTEVLEEAEQQVDRLRNLFAELAGRAVTAEAAGPRGQEAPALPEASGSRLLERVAARRRAFAEAMADDLNTAAALAEIFGLAREVFAALAVGEVDPATSCRVRAEMEKMAHVLGLDAVTESDEAIPAEIADLAEERQRCRAARDFSKADALRAAIAARGYEVRDIPDGYKVLPIR